MFGGFGQGLTNGSVSFASKAAIEEGIEETLLKEVLPVENCRGIGKADMVLNSLMPEIDVNPETYEVRANGELLTCEPAKALPMPQRYFLF
jgi:urease subunit alpha